MARAAVRAIAVAIAALGAVACGGSRAASPGAAAATPAPTSLADRMIALLPPGAQVVLEVDLARLRANPVVGAAVSQVLVDRPAVLRGDGAPSWAGVDRIVVAAYGVGSAQAATLTLLAAPSAPDGTIAVAEGLFALGPPEWVEPLQQRIALAGTGDAAFALRAEPELLALRDRAMPAQAPGAAVRVTARLSFDARVALARQTGLDAAPAQVSAWGDVVDDLALIVDCDAADPGGQPGAARGPDAAARMVATLRGALGALAAEPTVRALGLATSLGAAKLTRRGSWVRAIVAVGPAHLARVVDRARGLIDAPAPAPGTPTGAVAPTGAAPPRSMSSATPGAPPP